MIKYRLLGILSCLTAFVSYLVLLLGVTVTQTDSGQGCGNSWPFCHGDIVPNFLSINTVYEYSHRVMTGIDSTLIFALVLFAVIFFRKDFRIIISSIMSIFFLLLQAVLGALTVVYEGTYAKDGLLSLHFGFSLLAFGSVVLLALRIAQLRPDRVNKRKVTSQELEPVSKGLRAIVWLIAVYTYVVVYTGALVVHSSATLACGSEYPTCGSNYLPNLSSAAGIQVLHRYAAASIWFVILALMLVIVRNFHTHRDLVWGSLWAFVLVTLQALAGMGIVLTGAQLLATLLHTTLISVLFAVLCYLCAQVGWPFKKQPTSSKPQGDTIDTSKTVKENVSML
ncbi:COX15/CtaA family protein [Dictyobacter arantiisoli]|uniref:Heme A synthase n=1 Tax=Dictyobacter arantiisoli TaxID=2014874 RepID=A0A5A5TBL9_9CHLR|nr:COX15/CtaA family protein [Dictyobacter arantiisoli]GCF08413.1 heme A synthase [Dictyobacter arantiisoli]